MEQFNTNAAKIGRAVELGRELGGIHADPALNALSREAWWRKCLELGGARDKAALEEVRKRVEQCPALMAEVRIWVELQLQRGMREPVLSPIFDQAERFLAAYTERLAATLSPEQCSAVASWMVAERRPAEEFGSLADFSDRNALIEPRQAELVELDKQLRLTVRLLDLSWSGPVLRHKGLELPIGHGTVERIASSFRRDRRAHAGPRHRCVNRGEAAGPRWRPKDRRARACPVVRRHSAPPRGAGILARRQRRVGKSRERILAVLDLDLDWFRKMVEHAQRKWRDGPYAIDTMQAERARQGWINRRERERQVAQLRRCPAAVAIFRSVTTSKYLGTICSSPTAQR